MKIFLTLIALFSFNFSHASSKSVADNEDVWFKAAARKNNPQYRMQDCPVVGNLDSGIYHLPGQPNYKQMLYKNECVVKGQCADNRKCFENEDQARTAQIVACPLTQNGHVSKCVPSQKVSRFFVKALN